ncbi:MAG: DUF982 domain-containing protein [Rhizobiaceae bacterium]
MKRVKRLDTIIDETAASGTPVQRKGKTRRKEMAVLYTIRFGGGEPMPISCVADAVKALADPRWPGKEGAAHREAVRISNDALAGHCKATVALEICRKAAEDAGILGVPPGQKK